MGRKTPEEEIDETLRFLGFPSPYVDSAAQSVIAGLSNAGFVIVPIEPSKAMLKEASKAMSPGKRPTEEWVSCAEKHAIRYRAMITAAQAEMEGKE